jgi:hypothetical protein
MVNSAPSRIFFCVFTVAAQSDAYYIRSYQKILAQIRWLSILSCHLANIESTAKQRNPSLTVYQTCDILLSMIY